MRAFREGGTKRKNEITKSKKQTIAKADATEPEIACARLSKEAKSINLGFDMFDLIVIVCLVRFFENFYLFFYYC